MLSIVTAHVHIHTQAEGVRTAARTKLADASTAISEAVAWRPQLPWNVRVDWRGNTMVGMGGALLILESARDPTITEDGMVVTNHG